MRPPGEVRDAVRRTLQARPSGASVGEIVASVRELIGEVSGASIRSYRRLSTPQSFAKGSHCGHHGYMKEVAAREAKNRFGHLLDAAQSAPVRVTRKGRVVGVMMSVQQYERLRGAAWERLTATMDALGEEASANGLTKARLEALLADES